MNIQGIQGPTTTLRLASSASDGGAVAARSSAQKGVDTATAEPSADIDDKPATPRFPWLSRLSTQLAAASKTPTTFAAPIIGDNLDKRA